ILENSMQGYITLEKELQWLENYIALQALRFNEKFDYEITVDENLVLDNILIPPMLTQPFIENALEHGLKSIDYKGFINIRYTLKSDDLLWVEIEDNGVGLKKELNPEKEHISLATKITKERLLILN